MVQGRSGFCKAILDSMKQDIPRSSLLPQGQLDPNEYLKIGHVSFWRYPFMPAEYLRRSAQLIADVKARFPSSGSPCVLRGSTLVPSSCTSTPTKGLNTWKSLEDFLRLSNDILGLFTTSAIRAGDVIFRDPTTWGSSAAKSGNLHFTQKPCENCCGVPMFQKVLVIHQCEGCDATYCSKSCLDIARSTSHQALCDKDFSWVTHKPQSSSSKSPPIKVSDLDSVHGQTWLRILATCVQSGLHPLKHPSVVALTANYGVNNDTNVAARRWAMASHVDVPEKILTNLGIDIFKDQRYDTWVLQTIWWLSL